MLPDRDRASVADAAAVHNLAGDDGRALGQDGDQAVGADGGDLLVAAGPGKVGIGIDGVFFVDGRDKQLFGDEVFFGAAVEGQLGDVRAAGRFGKCELLDGRLALELNGERIRRKAGDRRGLDRDRALVSGTGAQPTGGGVDCRSGSIGLGDDLPDDCLVCGLHGRNDSPEGDALARDQVTGGRYDDRCGRLIAECERQRRKLADRAQAGDAHRLDRHLLACRCPMIPVQRDRAQVKLASLLRLTVFVELRGLAIERVEDRVAGLGRNAQLSAVGDMTAVKSLDCDLGGGGVLDKELGEVQNAVCDTVLDDLLHLRGRRVREDAQIQGAGAGDHRRGHGGAAPGGKAALHGGPDIAAGGGDILPGAVVGVARHGGTAGHGSDGDQAGYIEGAGVVHDVGGVIAGRGADDDLAAGLALFVSALDDVTDDFFIVGVPGLAADAHVDDLDAAGPLSDSEGLYDI